MITRFLSDQTLPLLFERASLAVNADLVMIEVGRQHAVILKSIWSPQSFGQQMKSDQQYHFGSLGIESSTV
jgi:hypothetical protein